MRAVTFAMSLKTFRGDPSFAVQNPRSEVRLFCLAAIAAARSQPLAKAAIVSKSIDDYARVALLRAFEKEPRLLAAVDHIAQRREKHWPDGSRISQLRAKIGAKRAASQI
jgi:hypothetical protein